MPRTPKRRAEKAAPVADEVLDQFGPATGMSMDEINAATRRLKAALVERMLGGELSHHLGYAPGGTRPDDTTNHRNGTSAKTVLTDDGPVDLAVPRDRTGTFEPVLVPKHARRLPGFDDKVLALYARGLPTREIQKFLNEIYAIDVSPDLISEVTDAVVAEVTAWQARPLEPMYPVVFFDALRVKIRDESVVRSKAVYLALAVLPDGTRDILGIWIEQTEGAKFWLRVMTEIKNRGVADILIAVVDGLKGFPEAITSVFALTQIQTCIVHLIRNSLEYVSWKDRKGLAAELKTIYRAESAEAALACLEGFSQGPWGQKYPPIGAMWKRQWEQVIPFFSYPAEVRKIIYTTNAIESLHMQLRKIIKNRGHFPNDDAAVKLLYLALKNITKDWKMSAREWKSAMNQFAILFADRFIPQSH